MCVCARMCLRLSLRREDCFCTTPGSGTKRHGANMVMRVTGTFETCECACGGKNSVQNRRAATRATLQHRAGYFLPACQGADWRGEGVTGRVRMHVHALS